MKVNLKETSIMTNMVEVMKSKMLHWGRPESTDVLFTTAFHSTAKFLGVHKSKEHKKAVRIDDIYGNFKMAAIVEYHPNEDDENSPGNYSLEYTLDEKDLLDVPNVTPIHDPMFIAVSQEVSFSSCGFTINKPEQVIPTYVGVVEALLYWLDNNAKEEEEVTIELPDVFSATVEIQNGVKVYAITPGGKTKQLVKGDLSIEA